MIRQAGAIAAEGLRGAQIAGDHCCAAGGATSMKGTVEPGIIDVRKLPVPLLGLGQLDQQRAVGQRLARFLIASAVASPSTLVL